MNLIYFYTSHGAASRSGVIDWSDKVVTYNSYAQNLWTEGRFQMLNALAERGHVDGIKIFIDSTRNPGVLKVNDKVTIYVVPHLDDSLKYINKGDIIYARGGFKPWYGTLQTFARNKHWIMFYRANTNRGNWPFWDIILDDLVDKNYNTGGRLGYAFSKPINQNIFKKMLNKRKLYDVMVGASHIHAKKGQHLTIQALLEYKKMFGNSLEIFFPGSFIKSSTNADILNVINSNRLNITFSGMISREYLANVMNLTKLFIHLGPGGQNDRGVLEAMACGVPVLVASKRYSPFVYNNPKVSKLLDFSPTDSKRVAEVIHEMLVGINKDEYNGVADYYLWENGMDEVCIPKMVKLINFIKENPVPDRPKLLKKFL